MEHAQVFGDFDARKWVRRYEDFCGVRLSFSHPIDASRHNSTSFVSKNSDSVRVR